MTTELKDYVRRLMEARLPAVLPQFDELERPIVDNQVLLCRRKLHASFFFILFVASKSRDDLTFEFAWSPKDVYPLGLRFAPLGYPNSAEVRKGEIGRQRIGRYYREKRDHWWEFGGRRKKSVELISDFQHLTASIREDRTIEITKPTLTVADMLPIIESCIKAARDVSEALQ